MKTPEKHPVEDEESWEEFLKRSSVKADDGSSNAKEHHSFIRKLRHRHHDKKKDAQTLEEEKEEEYREQIKHEKEEATKVDKKLRKKHKQALKELWRNPGIESQTVHGLMIDAGSTGSRLHVYEWEPRVLRNEQDIQEAVSGNKLSYPGTDHRWTARLRPGLADFGSLPDGELEDAVAEYLQPLLTFAETVLHTKEESFGEYPIYLRATAGMRILNPTDRARVMLAVRDLFANKTYCPFAFVDEQARVLSGEEESIFDWAGVNFLMGDLLKASEGAGTVVNPKQTFGSLDLGGGSTQIGFYEPNEDIMANLFKLQIGQSRHWNIYSHSFLYYGMNEAIHRFESQLTSDKSAEQRLVEGVYNPCLPGGSKKDIRSNVHVTSSGMETWNYTQAYPSGDGYYQATLRNDNERGDAAACMDLAKSLLHLEKNDWCQFAHGDCSFAGIYQPELPTQVENFGEFVAFSNYYHVWKFLDLPERATLNQLHSAMLHACAMSHDELLAFTDGRFQTDDVESYCFRSAYVFNLLRNGFGFQMTDSIRAVRVINGHKVGWALGAMLYEINTLPWKYSQAESEIAVQAEAQALEMEWDTFFIGVTMFVLFVTLFSMFLFRRRRNSRFAHEYEPIKDVQMEITA